MKHLNIKEVKAFRSFSLLFYINQSYGEDQKIAAIQSNERHLYFSRY
jgi:hypothetical protein